MSRLFGLKVAEKPLAAFPMKPRWKIDLGVSKKVSLEMIELAHRASVEVWVWTVDAPEIAQAMAMMGVDAIKTDSPRIMLDMLRNLKSR